MVLLSYEYFGNQNMIHFLQNVTVTDGKKRTILCVLFIFIILNTSFTILGVGMSVIPIHLH